MKFPVSCFMWLVPPTISGYPTNPVTELPRTSGLQKKSYKKTAYEIGKNILKGSLEIRNLSTQVINKQLIESGLLETDNSASNTKKVFGRRMIVLNRKRLINYMETVKTDFLQ